MLVVLLSLRTVMFQLSGFYCAKSQAGLQNLGKPVYEDVCDQRIQKIAKLNAPWLQYVPMPHLEG